MLRVTEERDMRFSRQPIDSQKTLHSVGGEPKGAMDSEHCITHSFY